MAEGVRKRGKSWSYYFDTAKINGERKKIEKEIASLEKMARAEKQPKKKFELVQQVKMLKKRLEG